MGYLIIIKHVHAPGPGTALVLKCSISFNLAVWDIYVFILNVFDALNLDILYIQFYIEYDCGPSFNFANSFSGYFTFIPI